MATAPYARGYTGEAHRLPAIFAILVLQRHIESSDRRHNPRIHSGITGEVRNPSQLPAEPLPTRIIDPLHT